VGAWARNTLTGGAYVFEDNGSGQWSEVANLSGPSGAFGFSVTQDSGRALIGSILNNAMLYERDANGAWHLTDALLSDKPYTPYSVSLDGRWAAIGNPHDPTVNENIGAVLVFHEDDSGHWGQVTKLTASDARRGVTFGTAVDIHGSRILIASDGKRQAYIFERGPDGAWTETALLVPSVSRDAGSFGYSATWNGHYIMVGASGRRPSGAVYVYHMPEPTTGVLAILGGTMATFSYRRKRKSDNAN
jgi:hypothetical protein